MNETPEWIKRFDKKFKDGVPPMLIHTSGDKRWTEHPEIKAFITIEKERSYAEGEKRIIKIVESTIDEFGDQGMACVSGILEEWFHGKPDVEY